ncbi:MAG: YciI family protein [Pyrinomonadaceae bacterium]
MKTALFVTMLFLVSAAASYGQKSATVETPKTVEYDAELAKRLGGDDNGMRTYVFCILKTGKKSTEFKEDEYKKLFAGHMANIGKLADEGKLAVAGPFKPNEKNYRGLYIFNVSTIEEAEKLVMTDPAVKAGALVPDLTVLATPEIHKRITKPAQ